MSYPMLQGILRENKKKSKKIRIKNSEKCTLIGTKIILFGNKMSPPRENIQLH